MQSDPQSVRFGRSTATRAGAKSPRRRDIGATSMAGARRWPALTWPVSFAAMAIPLALVLLTVAMPRFAASPIVSVVVSDRYTGEPLSGALLAFNGETVTAAADGSARVEIPADPLQVIVSAPDYEAVSTTLQRGGPHEWQVALRPNVLRGTVTDADSNAGIPGVAVALNASGAVVNTTTTANDGTFTFAGVPDGATLSLNSADYGNMTAPVEQHTDIALTMKPSFVTGAVTDAGGNPISGARIAAVNGSTATTTGADGTFRLSGGSDMAEVKVSAAGYSDQVVMIDDSRQVAAVLNAEQIKAIYANLGVLSDPERWNRLLEIADSTEINAIVVDVKQDTIYYDTQVPFFRDIEGMVTPLFDPKELLAELDAHGIYSIARMVVFKDPLVAKARPDLAVRDENTGDVWLDYNDIPWVNAFYEELWQANADLGTELAQLGFDEVQYDYIRFPSDGDLRTADFGNDYTEADRRAAITGAVALASEQIRAAGAHFALDLFPIVALLGDDQGIGQTVQDLAPYADYVCLMIYPSHYALGNIPVDGHPNDFPAETVTYTLQRSQEWAPDTMAKMRPWLQDFTYPAEGFSEYGPEQVRAQIDAAEAMGVSGWLLWNAAGEFEVDALIPQ